MIFVSVDYRDCGDSKEAFESYRGFLVYNNTEEPFRVCTGKGPRHDYLVTAMLINGSFTVSSSLDHFVFDTGVVFDREEEITREEFRTLETDVAQLSQSFKDQLYS